MGTRTDLKNSQADRENTGVIYRESPTGLGVDILETPQDDISMCLLIRGM